MTADTGDAHCSKTSLSIPRNTSGSQGQERLSLPLHHPTTALKLVLSTNLIEIPEFQQNEGADAGLLNLPPSVHPQKGELAIKERHRMATVSVFNKMELLLKRK